MGGVERRSDHDLITISGVIMALVVELEGREGVSAAAIGLAVITLAMAWVVFNVRFALHDAHLYYRDGGRSLPEDHAPDARDFACFAFVVGMTFQVSDVAVTRSSMRRHVLIQGPAALLFKPSSWRFPPTWPHDGVSRGKRCGNAYRLHTPAVSVWQQMARVSV